MKECRRVLIAEVPWSEVKAGEFGALFPDKEVEVDGDRKTVRFYQLVKGVV